MNAGGPAADELTLNLTREIAASRDAVYACFADSSRLAQWWGPAGFSVPRLDFDPRIGASYRIEMQPPEGDAFGLQGEFREVDRPARLAFTFAWDPAAPDDVETLADLTFRERGDSTEVVLAQGRFKTEERVALHRDGWTDSFDRLERLLA